MDKMERTLFLGPYWRLLEAASLVVSLQRTSRDETLRLQCGLD